MRTVVWADLIRSAWGGGAAGRAPSQSHGASATLKMDDCVREAAPYCLHAKWTIELDREMVMLQVRCSTSDPGLSHPCSSGQMVLRTSQC